MEGGHTVQPRLSQFGRGAVALCQTVMEVQQLLGVILVSLGSGVRGQGSGEREGNISSSVYRPLLYVLTGVNIERQAMRSEMLAQH